MRTIFQCGAISAVLAAIVVAALNTSGAAAVPAGKLYADRLPQAEIVSSVRLSAMPIETPAAVPTGRKGDRMDATPDICANAVWPYLPQGCLAGAAGPARIARTITIERRVDVATSALERVPAVTVAHR